MIEIGDFTYDRLGAREIGDFTYDANIFWDEVDSRVYAYSLISQWALWK